MNDNAVSTPLQLDKDNFIPVEEFLKDKLEKILSEPIGKEVRFPLDEDQYIEISNSLIVIQNSYFNAGICFKDSKDKTDSSSKIFYIARLSNYIIEIQRNIINCDINEPYNAEEVDLEVIAMTIKGEITKPIKLSGFNKKSIREFREKIYSFGNFIDIFKDFQFSQIFDHIYSNTDIPKYYSYRTPGLIPDQNIWLMSNVIIDINTGKIIERSIA